MFSFLRKRTRSTTKVSSSRATRLAKAWLGVNRLESREVPATFVVSTLDDGVVAGPGQLPGSLRQAIFDSNALAGADTINFVAVSGTLSIIANEFTITDSVTINGPGASIYTIDAQSNSRHFNISDNKVTQITVSMSGMKLINGQAPDPDVGISGSGGSIFGRNEILYLDSMVIIGNKTSNVVGVGRPSGGAISMGDAPVAGDSAGLGSTLIINNSQIDNNYTDVVLK